jgi:antitoxin component of MazEF toxin-antitoxin module
MAQKVIKTGNSLAVTIPSEFVRTIGIRPGDEVRLRVEADLGQLTYSFSGVKQLTLADSLTKTKNSC